MLLYKNFHKMNEYLLCKGVFHDPAWSCPIILSCWTHTFKFGHVEDTYIENHVLYPIYQQRCIGHLRVSAPCPLSSYQTDEDQLVCYNVIFLQITKLYILPCNKIDNLNNFWKFMEIGDKISILPLSFLFLTSRDWQNNKNHSPSH